MRLEVGRIDHQPVRLAFASGQPGEDAVEDPHAAPADEAVVQGFVRTVLGGRIAPAQAVADDVEDAADDTLVVHPRNPVRERGKGQDPLDLCPCQPGQIRHGSTSCRQGTTPPTIRN
jgi:hypothetical protein